MRLYKFAGDAKIALHIVLAMEQLIETAQPRYKLVY